MLFDILPPVGSLETTPAAYIRMAQADASPHVQTVLEECQGVETQNPPGGTFFSPSGAIRLYWNNHPKQKIGSGDLTQAKVTVLEQPKYGVLKDLDEINRDMGPVYAYDVIEGTPNGTEDRAVFLVEIGGKRIKIVERFILTFNYESLKGCNGKDYYIRRISQVVDETSISPYELLQLSMAQGVDYRMASLQGTTLAETTGTGAESIITLDSDAAGHGWYIDYTPYLNEEFLPTSNPNEWIAKPGSEAEGKMDMLTVLLHEYGHALGLDHTADAHDFMAATLQPGVRRTLTVDEQLELMRLAGIFVTPESPSEPYAPTDPGAPLPFTRVVATRSARRAAGFDSLVPQFDTAANPKLTNSDFASAEGWSTTGEVRFENGTATLAEGAATQTRLNQVFVVNEGDRFLSFTVANTALGDQAYGPDDAFEVALLDANTGLSLLGGTGLTKSDAALNRQADGSEFKASGISSVANADGSRTYLVDLAGVAAGVAAGTVVNLSFDLIGFGKGLEAQNSRFTYKLSDAPKEAPLGGGHVDSNLATVVLTVRPVNDAPTRGDQSRTGREDEIFAGSLLTTAEDIDSAALAARIFSGPAHGQLVVGDNGRFVYVPAQG